MRFDSYHPVINLIYFVSSIVMAICFNHPIYIAISFSIFFCYSIKLIGKRALIFNILCIPLGVISTLWYSYYTHFGVTVIGINAVGNSMTLESIIYGATINLRVVTILMILSCIFEIFTGDKIAYLFGRISPKLSLFISIILRTIPRLRNEAIKINYAQSGIGRGINQGNIFRRIRNAFRVFYVLIMSMISNFIEESSSMKARGYTLKGRTAFSRYRFDNRDRAFVISIFFFLTIMLCANMLNQTMIRYNPQILMSDITIISIFFYISYFIYLSLPLMLELIMESRYNMLKRRI